MPVYKYPEVELHDDEHEFSRVTVDDVEDSYAQDPYAALIYHQ